MLEEMIAFRKRVEKLIGENPAGTDWNRERDFFNTRFSHLQRERLIHLLVSLTVGLAGLISCMASLAFPSAMLLILDLMLIGLFIAYLVYYRKLENTAQGWYSTLEKLEEKIRK